jgi:hypothetical protein
LIDPAGSALARPIAASTADAPPLRTALVVLATAALLAGAGVALGLADLIAGDHAQPATTSFRAPAGVAWAAPVSFGALAVRRVERTAGTTHGAGHAVDGVRHDEVRVLLTLGNRRSRAVAFSPGQFRLRLDGLGTTVPPVRPNPPPGGIAAAETVSQRLTFVVPARRTAFALLFDDLERSRPLIIALGSLPRPASRGKE